MTKYETGSPRRHKIPLCRILGGVSAAFLLLAAWLFGETALTALCFKAIRISENGAVWELWPFLQNVYILSPALILAVGAVFAVYWLSPTS